MKNNITPLEVEALVESNLNLVWWIVSSYMTTKGKNMGLEVEDLFQEGCIWLLHAARTYDPQRAKFSTFATTVIRNGIIAHHRRLRFHTPATVSLDDDANAILRRAGMHDDLEARFSETDTLALLESAKRGCSGVTLRGIEALELRAQGLTNVEIAAMLGVSPNNVRAWISRAKKRLLADEDFMAAIGRWDEDVAA